MWLDTLFQQNVFNGSESPKTGDLVGRGRGAKNDYHFENVK